ncbi:hypothetical protein SAMN05216287_2263 [Pseudomonas kuykendallii]|uniref:Uncharacterized protein n=1 Tax=Pseudomonas kuykendallii TaxID=1007099 RepID=A0A1H2ZDV1_9PSED|nr:hypothetical protein SAMN05216287_2263 [Pseudomonas kuykendallii]
MPPSGARMQCIVMVREALFCCLMGIAEGRGAGG